MDFQVQTVPDNHFTVEVSAPGGKVNNVNKDGSVRWPPWVWESVGICGTKRKVLRIFFFYSIYLLFVPLVLCARRFLSLQCTGFSWLWLLCGRAQALGRTALAAQGIRSSNCRAQAQYSWHRGLAVPQHVECSWTRDWIHVTCIGRRIFFIVEPPGKHSSLLILNFANQSLRFSNPSEARPFV